MALFLTSNSLITSVKRRAMIPENQSTFTTADFLDLANEEIITEIVPEILRLHEDYLMVTTSTPLLANTDRYVIPHRAIGNKLREVSFRDESGNVLEMTRVGIGDLPEYNLPFTQNRIHAYYIENNEIVLLPPQTGSPIGSLVFTYYLRPNELVTEDRVATITNINTSTGEITVNTVPSVFSINNTYDIIKAKSPHNTISLELTATAINTTTNTITFATSDLSSRLEVGDYINLACETIVPQIPADLHSMLAHKVAMRCQEAMGDLQALQLSTQKERRIEDRLTNLIDNRVEDAPRKINNRHGHLRQGLYRRRYRYRG